MPPKITSLLPHASALVAHRQIANEVVICSYVPMKIAGLRPLAFTDAIDRPELFPNQGVEIQGAQLIDHAPNVDQPSSKHIDLVTNGRRRKSD